MDTEDGGERPAFHVFGDPLYSKSLFRFGGNFTEKFRETMRQAHKKV